MLAALFLNAIKCFVVELFMHINPLLVIIQEDVNAVHVFPAGCDPDELSFGRIKPLFSAPLELPPGSWDDISAYDVCRNWVASRYQYLTLKS